MYRTLATAAIAATISLSAQAAPIINCGFQIKDKAQLTQENLRAWGEQAALAIFDYDYRNQEQRFAHLRQCFSSNGWKSFNDALQRSNNLDVIKKHKLSVHAKALGEAKVTESKDDTWEIAIPLEIKYENTSQHANQQVNATMVVALQPGAAAGLQHLGINQFIAKPR